MINKTKIDWCDYSWDRENAFKYIAWFFDVECSFMILNVLRKNFNKYPFRLRPKISIAQKNPTILYWIKNVLGYGRVQDQKKSLYKYLIHSINDCSKFIDEVGKYIICKKKQKKILKEFLFYKNTKSNKPYKKDIFYKMLFLRNQLNQLNDTTRDLKYSLDEVMEVNYDVNNI